MTQKPELIIQATLAVATTVALSVASVWLCGDSRVAGLVVMVAGIAVSGVIGYNELRATPRHPAETSGCRGHRGHVESR